MTKENAEAFGIVIERLTRPAMTVLFSASICYMGVRTVQNISADQFVGIVTAIVMFWFGQRTAEQRATDRASTTTTNVTPTTVAVETKT